MPHAAAAPAKVAVGRRPLVVRTLAIPLTILLPTLLLLPLVTVAFVIPKLAKVWRQFKSKNMHLHMYNLFVTSKNETTNSPIYEFKVLHKGQRVFQTPF